MEKENNFPFPQADDFEKVVSLLNIKEESSLKNKTSVSMLLGDIDSRQVQYYLSALMYLDLVQANKSFTSKGQYIRSLGFSRQIVELARIIVSKDVFGTVYFTEKSLKVKMDRNDVIEVMKEFVHFSSDAMYKRRSQTVIKWIEWVNKNF
ncbi:MAG: hypothetical protein PHF05_05815 [Candidatus Izemoplasmatales bacterium]|nr:hypothetical protein [Candidatus Izemoplasmatales bacterium]